MTETWSAVVESPQYPQQRTCPYRPATEHHRPVTPVRLYDGRPAWLVTGHREARQVLLDAATFSSDRQHPAFPALAPRFEAARKVRNFIGMDPPEHTGQRRMLISSFTAKRVATLRPAITEIVDRLLDDVVARGPGVDLVPTFALPVPSVVICHLLGVPYADHEFFEQQSRRIASGTSTAAESADAFGQLKRYLHGLIEAKRGADGEDLLDVLVAEQVQTGALDPGGLVDLALLLLVAGHETTASALALGVVLLVEQHGGADAADPARVAAVVEEVLRQTAVADGVARFATRDAEVGGVRVAAGEAVVVGLSAANHDPSVFPDPERFDPARAARHHVTFGHGVHQCIGANLARAELEIALSRLFTRLPTLAVAVPAEELGSKDAGGVQGVQRLPVTW
ncbi:cytochrome [Micromonospora wenchangensis]|uniref:Cytochrome n=1 Tax=Micromonospora wenchangensis TaxID=1185415 RepID=A0A246RK45_9ACTN|nr:cytochrome P450 [Micromonospora wenchangensis]OWV05808.1 cytochrome [Micromonospora wenchangensis]